MTQRPMSEQPAFAAYGGVLVGLDWPASGRPWLKCDLLDQRAAQCRAEASHRRACAALTNTMPSAVCAVDAAFTELADTALCAP